MNHDSNEILMLDSQPFTMTHAPLFDLLDAVIRAERQPARLPGRVAIGVLGPGGTTWWCADLRERVTLSRGPDRPEADAWLMTTGSEAARWARGEGLSAEPRLRLAGDRTLLDRFVQCYLGKKDLVAVRADRGGR